MPKCTSNEIDFGRFGRRQIVANFDGGEISSEAGVMLLRQVDRKIGLSAALSRAFCDPRAPSRIKHALRTLIAQRLYAQCQGWEDLNDHNRLRHDLAMQTALDTAEPLASASTLCRFEQRATREQAWALHAVLVDQFIARFKTPPKELVLDFDASDIPLHGEQQGKQFHGYYDHYCYLPLYVFCGQAMLACYLRNSRIDGAKHSAAILKLLVRRLRQSWPQVRLIVRADSGFCRQRLLRYCERHQVGYVIGMARNKRLEKLVAQQEAQLRADWQASHVKQRAIGELRYAAQSWKRERRLLSRLEYGPQGNNPRFVVTNLDGSAKELYDTLYCQRGEAENRIKEVQLDLFGTRTSCHKFVVNQLRVLWAALGYTLMERLRALALFGTELERACASSIRVRLLKIGAAIVRNTRRVRLMLSSRHPLRHLFLSAAQALAP
jgi:hypothetical protein